MIKSSEFAVNNKRALVFSAFMLAVLGGYLIFQIPQGVFPDSAYPRITIVADYGLAPLKQMEMEITKPIEEAMIGIPGARGVRSTTSRGSAEVDVDFNWKEDMFKAYQFVQARVSGIQNQLPPGVDILVRRFTTSTYPVTGYSLVSNRHNLIELNDLALYTIRPQLAGIPGVSKIEIMGGNKREYWINLDPNKLIAMNLDYRQIIEVINKTNIVQFVGRLRQFNKLFLNIADNRYLNLDEIGNTIVDFRNPTPIRLSDIATIEPAVQETYINCISNQRPAVLVNIIKQPGSNAVSITQEVEKRLQSIRKDLPPGVEMKKWYDLSEFIQKSMASVRGSIFLGALFTIVVLFLFLRRIRLTIVTAAIIPIALLITFILIKLTGMNLSLMSLGGLAAAIGILVDNAIVVVENIERYLEQGKPKIKAVIQATTEIISPLLGATFTTIVVFIPLIFLTGLPGIFFRALATTLTLTVAVSMLLAMFLTPALAAIFITSKTKKPGRILPKIITLQQKTLKFTMKRPLIVIVLVLLLSVLSITSYLLLPSGFLPKWDEDTIIIDCWAPPGSSLEGTKDMLSSIGEYVMKQPEVQVYSLRIGRSLAHPRKHANFGDFAVTLKSGRKRSSFELIDDIREFIARKEPRLRVELFQVLPDRLMDLSGRLAPIVIKVFSKNLHQAQSVATQIADSLEHIPGVVDVYPGFQASEPELTIRVIPEAASRYGLTVEDINRAVKMALWGEVATEVMEGLKIIPVRVRYAKSEFKHLEKIRRLPIYFPGIRRMLTLEEVADINQDPGQPDVNHENLSQVVNVAAHLSGRDLGSIVRDIKHVLGSIYLPPGVSLQLGGEYQSQQQAFKELMLILLFGIFLVFTILLFEFKSFRVALVILIGTVLSVSGVFLSLLITRISLDISAFMGMIMIVGVVVNNGILLIDYTEKYLVDSKSISQALLRASRVRLRPILMTTFSTIFAFLPLSLAIGQGAEMLQPLAVSMIGGMSLSILLSLIIIPTLYYLVNKTKPGLTA